MKIVKKTYLKLLIILDITTENIVKAIEYKINDHSDNLIFDTLHVTGLAKTGTDEYYKRYSKELKWCL